MKHLMVFAGYVAISGWKRFYKIQKSKPWYNLSQWRLTQEVSAREKDHLSSLVTLSAARGSDRALY